MAKGTIRQKKWIDIFDGKKIKNVDNKTKLNARLARAAVMANEDQIEKEWQTKDMKKLLKNIFKQAEKIGYLKSPSLDLRGFIKNKIQWRWCFSFVQKVDHNHQTLKDVQNVPNTEIEVTETFWDIVMDETGNRLIAFWPAQKKQITTNNNLRS